MVPFTCHIVNDYCELTLSVNIVYYKFISKYFRRREYIWKKPGKQKMRFVAAFQKHWPRYLKKRSDRKLIKLKKFWELEKSNAENYYRNIKLTM